MPPWITLLISTINFTPEPFRGFDRQKRTASLLAFLWSPSTAGGKAFTSVCEIPAVACRVMDHPKCVATLRACLPAVAWLAQSAPSIRLLPSWQSCPRLHYAGQGGGMALRIHRHNPRK